MAESEPDPSLPEGRPTMQQVWERYQETFDAEGRPYHLDLHDEIYDIHRPRIPPSRCRGPSNVQLNCGRINFCCWCYERRRRRDALNAALIHIGQPNLYRISIPLSQGRNHPMHARRCLRRIHGVLERHNFSRVTLWLKPFEDNPCDGVRAHVEGIVSGFDADPDALDPSNPNSLGLILERFREGGEDSGQPATVNVQPLHPHSRKHVHALVEQALDCSKPLFPVRRIWAGLYVDKKRRVRCRMTTMTDGMRPAHTKELPCPAPDHRPHATRDELLTWAVMAEHWRETVGRPIMTRHVRVPQHLIDLVLEATPWRQEYRLEDEEAVREKWELPAILDGLPHEFQATISAMNTG